MAQKKKVLVVEDEKALSKVMGVKLESSGYDVLISDNGEEAVEFFEKESPDIVLLDLMIPGIDGFAVLEKIKKEMKSDVPIFVLSNLGQSEDMEKAKSLGAMGYFVKANTPINDIVTRVKEILK